MANLLLATRLPVVFPHRRGRDSDRRPAILAQLKLLQQGEEGAQLRQAITAGKVVSIHA
jgi:hypothetical protein